MSICRRLWNDEAGFVISTELVLIATVLVIGLLVGMATLRDAVVQELGDVADVVASINQSYSYSAIVGHSSSTAGSFREDLLDYCDETDNNDGGEPACISITCQDATAESN